MNRPRTVYVLLNPIAKLIYVGQTANVTKRMHCHRHSPKQATNKPVVRAFREHGFDSFQLREVFTSDDHDIVNQMEAMCIQQMVMPGWTSLNSCTYSKKDFSRQPLTQGQVLEIAGMLRHEPSLSKHQIAAMFRVNYNTVQEVNTGSFHTRSFDPRLTHRDVFGTPYSYPIRQRYKRSVSKRVTRKRAA
jgi:hypothetical protein